MDTFTCPTCGGVGNPENFGRGQYRSCDPCEAQRKARLQRAANTLDPRTAEAKHLARCGYTREAQA